MTQILTEEKKWTYNDYLNLEDEKRFEIIGGRLIMMSPAPETNHQLISARLGFSFIRFVEPNGLGYILYAPTDVILDAENVVQPDILFIAKDNKHIIKKRGVFGAPELVVEILSPSTQYKDVFEKKNLYERFRVKEYWMVNPYMKSIEVLSLNENGVYTLFSEGYMDEGGNRVIRSKVLKDFSIDLCEVFKEYFL